MSIGEGNEEIEHAVEEHADHRKEAVGFHVVAEKVLNAAKSDVAAWRWILILEKLIHLYISRCVDCREGFLSGGNGNHYKHVTEAVPTKEEEPS